jgi:hypothetical protein
MNSVQYSMIAAAVFFIVGGQSLDVSRLDPMSAQEEDEPLAEDALNQDIQIDPDEIEEGEAAEDDIETVELLPVWVAPGEYRLHLQISFGKKSVSVRRFVSGKRIRSEIESGNSRTVLIELGDPQGTAHELSPADRTARRLVAGRSLRALDSRELGSDLDGWSVEYLGGDMTAGKRSLRYRIESTRAPVFAWFDVRTGFPLRMETDEDGLTYVIEWSSLVTNRQPDDLFEVPEDYTIGELDVTPAARNVSESAVIGQLSEEQVADLESKGPDPMWESVFRAPLTRTEPGGSDPFGGSLGLIAGEYVPGWLGAILAGSTRHYK